MTKVVTWGEKSEKKNKISPTAYCQIILLNLGCCTYYPLTKSEGYSFGGIRLSILSVLMN